MGWVTHAKSNHGGGIHGWLDDGDGWMMGTDIRVEDGDGWMMGTGG